MFEDLPVAAAFALLWLIGTLRAGATYALGRAARGAGARGAPIREFLERPEVTRAERSVERFGAPAVTLCFLTVGIQTGVNLAAGALRMPLRRYVPALLIGTAIWATIYVTVGLAVLGAFWGGHPWLWGIALAAVLLAALVARIVRRRLAG